MRFTLLVLLWLPLVSVAAARDFHFTYSAADLVSPEGLYTRLDRAAADHCRSAIDDIRNMRGQQACKREVVAMAVEQIDHPQLSAYVEAPREHDKG